MQLTEKRVQTASEIIIKTLQKLDTDIIFGYPGSSVLPIYDELSRQTSIRHCLLRHEQSAVHAAEGYARVSGKCGFVLVTSGPGASNTITGIANAYLDGFPIVVISGQTNSELAGRDAFQEIDFAEMVKPCTKAVFKVCSAEELETVFLQAYSIAMSGKKGPVAIEIPVDILSQPAEYKNFEITAYKAFDVSSFDIYRVVEALETSKTPVLVCGGGVLHAGAEKQLSELVDRLNIPVVCTMMGLGAFDANNPCFAGMIGVYGDETANKLVENADMLIVLGARLNDRVTSAFDMNDFNRKTIVQVDINSKELIRNFSSDIALNLDIKAFLKAMLNNSPSVYFEDIPRISRSLCSKSEALSSSSIVKALYRFEGESPAIISVDVGQHQISLIKNYKFNSASKLLVSGGLGTMGFGLPAAIGASIAAQNNQPVVLVTGDGSFQMSSAELAVCAELNLPVKILIMNNKSLGMVRQLQDEQFEKRRYETSLQNPDFVMLAKSYGVEALRVESEDEIMSALEKAFEAESPFVIEFVTDSEEVV